jgi:DNA modification methylase
MTYKIHTGDNRDILKTLADNSIDAIVTDPPYGIDFLGKSWDANTGALETYEECLRVLKPGGHILAFSAARTYHHLAITLEQAGFEIRDQIMWIYSSGFPKSQDIGKSIQRSLGVEETKPYQWNAPVKGGRASKDDLGEGSFATGKEDIKITSPEALEWQGWGTALKPAHEPICLARKPLKQSIAKNCQEWGVGALNIDATRVGDEEMIVRHLKKDNGQAFTHHGDGKKNWDSYEDVGTIDGRFPSNVLGEIAEEYQKYFYCPKVSRQERHIGYDLPPAMFGNVQGCYDENGERYAVGLDARTGNVGNNHPTVKPVELMKYLIKLITPPGGTVLDPFNGSGTTGMAATELGFDYIGCELDPKYVEISEKRIEAWRNRDYDADAFDDLFTFGD